MEFVSNIGLEYHDTVQGRRNRQPMKEVGLRNIFLPVTPTHVQLGLNNDVALLSVGLEYIVPITLKI